ncbi:MAG: hypothetical protein QNJ63_04185 [Calothrix sp. MO_192.B10]|nr:hypothetical protein [Calothrix sp. MO_192.B10]
MAEWKAGKMPALQNIEDFSSVKKWLFDTKKSTPPENKSPQS